MPAIALVTDLIFATKIKTTADAVGVAMSVVRSPDALDPAGDDGLTLVIVDLNADNVDVIDVIRRYRSGRDGHSEAEMTVGVDDATSAPMVIAYASHVQRDLLQAARDAGADLVLPRSKFSVELPALLEQYGRLPERP